MIIGLNRRPRMSRVGEFFTIAALFVVLLTLVVAVGIVMSRC